MAIFSFEVMSESRAGLPEPEPARGVGSSVMGDLPGGGCPQGTGQCRLSALSSAVGSQLPPVTCRLFCHLSPITYHLSPMTYPATRHLPPAICHLLAVDFRSSRGSPLSRIPREWLRVRRGAGRRRPRDLMRVMPP